MPLVSSSFLCFALSFAVVKEWREHGVTFTKSLTKIRIKSAMFPIRSFILTSFNTLIDGPIFENHHRRVLWKVLVKKSVNF